MEATTNRHRLPDPTMPGKQLASKLVKVIGQVTNVPKNGFNDFHKYAFARAEDVLAVLRASMAQNGLAAHTTVLDHETEQISGKEIRTSVVLAVSVVDSESGEACTSYYVGQGVDKGDKAYYKAYTGALKYALQQMFLLPMGDDPEGDTTVDQRSSQQPAQPRKKKGNTTGSPARNRELNGNGQQKKKAVTQVPSMMFADGQAPVEWLASDNGGLTAHQYEFLITALHRKMWHEVQNRVANKFEGVTELKDLTEQQAQILIDGITGVNQQAQG